ncbi:hypothetical protein V2G26_019764 [Clonostachys chloroleuca]
MKLPRRNMENNLPNQWLEEKGPQKSSAGSIEVLLKVPDTLAVEALTSAMLHVIKMDIQVLAEQCFNECAVKKVLVEPGEFKEAGKLIMLARK